VRYRAVFSVRTYGYKPVVDTFILVDMQKAVVDEAAARILGEVSTGYRAETARSIQSMTLRAQYNSANMYNMHLEQPLEPEQVEKVILARFRRDPDTFNEWLNQFKM